MQLSLFFSRKFLNFVKKKERNGLKNSKITWMLLKLREKKGKFKENGLNLSYKEFTIL